LTGMAAPLRSSDAGRSRGLEAATFVLAGIGGFSDGEREMIVRFIKMGRVRVGSASEGWAPPLTGLGDRAFVWSEFDRWHAFFSACGIFPERWDGLQVVPTATTAVAVAMKYRQQKLEFLLEWLDMLTRRPAELGHYTRRGRRVQIVRQEDDHRCSVCASFNGHEVKHGSDTMPPLHPGCRCVLMAAMTVPASERIGTPPRERSRRCS
jgi:hypothetical protein